MEFRRRLGRDVAGGTSNHRTISFFFGKPIIGHCPNWRGQKVDAVSFVLACGNARTIVIGSLEGLMHRTGGFFKRPADFLRRRQLNFHRVCSCFSFACPFRRDWTTYALLCLFNPFFYSSLSLFFTCTQGKFILR